MARLLVIAQGSLGDTLPMLRLAHALRARGHDLRVLGPAHVSGIADSYGLAFEALRSNDPQMVLQDISRQTPRGRLGKALRVIHTLARKPYLPDHDYVCSFRDCVSAADLVITSYIESAVTHVAEAARRPAIVFHPTPALPTSVFPHPVGPLAWHLLPKPGVLNASSHAVWNRLVFRAARQWVRELREARLGLPRSDARFARVPRLVAASGVIFPAPGDWPAEWRLSGYLPDPTGETAVLPDEVERFLRRGDPPVFFGFSSSPVARRDFWREVVAETTARLGRRAIVAAGWSDVPPHIASERVLIVRHVPYARLFPRVAAVVHACGVGTLSEAVRSGTPSVALPVFGEQKLVAAVAYRRGLIPRPVMVSSIDAARLTTQLRAVLDDDRFRERTRRAARAMREEAAADTACRFVEETLAGEPGVARCA